MSMMLLCLSLLMVVNYQNKILNMLLSSFLMCLNETYNAVHNQFLLMTPLPCINQAYSMLVQKESQR
ncbi:hypothetical protein EPI10_007304 [Gossypium australe]|uniref:Uncharacterized protein n=1 Tax=Gossypium australe TaxID=47621 RepID=A0A5B6WTP3_9ROSI|nr:hypothetical protein EPI10_007304 [Gossypium australe]